MQSIVEKPLVGVIMPVHNTMRHLREAIASLLGQTWGDLQIVCVDDGSSDGSLEYLESVAATDSRVRVVSNAGSGAGAARNTGLSLITAEWVIFLDSDDVFDERLIERLVGEVVAWDADIAICDFLMFDDKSGRERPSQMNLGRYRQGRPVLDSGKRSFLKLSPAPWNKLIRRSLLVDGHIFFQNIQNANDLYAIVCVLLDAERVCFVDERLVRYRRGSCGGTQDTKSAHPTEILKALTALADRYARSTYGDPVMSDVIWSLCARQIRFNLQSLRTCDARESLWDAARDAPFFSSMVKGLESTDAADLRSVFDRRVVRAVASAPFSRFDGRGMIERLSRSGVAVLRNHSVTLSCLISRGWVH